MKLYCDKISDQVEVGNIVFKLVEVAITILTDLLTNCFFFFAISCPISLNL